MSQSIGILGSGWLGKQFVEQCKSKYDLHATNTSKIDNAIGYEHYVVKLPETWSQEFFDAIEVLIISISPQADNFMQSMELLAKSLEKQSNIKKIILWSTIGVYGNRTGILDEDFTASPERPAAKTMLEVEKLLENHCQDRLQIMRIGGLVGKGRHPGHFFPDGKIVTRSHDRINLVHGDDVIAITKLLVEGEIDDPLINVVAPYHPMKKDFYSDARKEVGQKTIPMDKKGEIRIIQSYVLNELEYQFIYRDLSDWSIYG